MVLSAATKKEPSGAQRIAICSISTVGIVLTIFPGKGYANPTTPFANTPHTNSQNPVHQSPVRQSPAHQDPAHQDPAHQNPAHQDPARANSAANNAIELEAAADRAGLERLRARLFSPKTTAEVTAPPAQGIYHYGQQPIVDQPETAYFVFESQGANVAGALYMPSSSFDCVQGRIVDQQMALSITDSYSQETYSYALALNEPTVEVASQGGAIASPPNIDGFYPLPLREQDRAILATCQAI